MLSGMNEVNLNMIAARFVICISSHFLPSSFCDLFIPKITVWGDMDALNHVNNAKYLTYGEQARIEMWDDVGIGCSGKEEFVSKAR